MNLVWFHNDLRTGDNHSLQQACSSDAGVIALYCFDPQYFRPDEFGFRRTAKYRARFLRQSLGDLRTQLRALNISLMICHGDPATLVPDIVRRYNVTDIYRQREWTRDERQTLERVFAKPEMRDVNLHEYYDQFLLHPDDIPIASLDDIPQVFSKFRDRCEAETQVRRLVPVPPGRRPGNLIECDSRIPQLEELGLELFDADPRSAFPFVGGSNAGRARIHQYFWRTLGLTRYKHTRDGLLGRDYSSKLSPWLANGCLSPRQVYWKVKAFERDVIANQDTYWLIFELLWRDYFKYISLQQGDRIFRAAGLSDGERQWQRDPEVLQQWIEGRTPYDFVNANMREIAATGWMSNRGRQVVANYWCKELGQDWRIGAAWFESLLIDYDVHSNYGNWLYQSGVGNDPRDRKFEIDAQADRYDPDGSYRQLWSS
ncbi:DASH family cryptochrome [Microbulbifer hainanensis]|uniref:DASH family cryptochrome n=1 Tax=Microbulbifer hainanensis TaxID=2735675 RepID=UPI0018685F09|nr:DASH family cryptochrome [Microbulbifer hainanensis]